mgnify:CR=1 FL=1
MNSAVILPFWVFVVVAVLAAWAAYDKLLMRIVNLGLSYMPEWRMFEG